MEKKGLQNAVRQCQCQIQIQHLKIKPFKLCYLGDVESETIRMKNNNNNKPTGSLEKHCGTWKKIEEAQFFKKKYSRMDFFSSIEYVMLYMVKNVFSKLKYIPCNTKTSILSKSPLGLTEIYLKLLKLT